MIEPCSTRCIHCRHRTQYTFQLLTTSILAYSKKRNYEDYKARRTADIWANREELIAYEDALKLEAEIDDLTNEGRERNETSIAPETIGGNVLCCCQQTCAELSRTGEGKKAIGHRLVREKFETIYSPWKRLIKEPWKDRAGLERFEYGAVRAQSNCVLLIYGW